MRETPISAHCCVFGKFFAIVYNTPPLTDHRGLKNTTFVVHSQLFSMGSAVLPFFWSFSGRTRKNESKKTQDRPATQPPIVSKIDPHIF